MVESVSCIVPVFFIQEEYAETEYARIVFGREDIHGGTKFAKCPDCATPLDGIHHFLCDWEQCPRCGEQLLGCDCEVMPMKKVLPETTSRLQMVLDFE